MNTPEKENMKNAPNDKSPEERKIKSIAVNPNPAANANIRDKLDENPDLKKEATYQTGSEITDGEAG